LGLLSRHFSLEAGEQSDMLQLVVGMADYEQNIIKRGSGTQYKVDSDQASWA
jgi:hypothetical protein